MKDQPMNVYRLSAAENAWRLAHPEAESASSIRLFRSLDGSPQSEVWPEPELDLVGAEAAETDFPRLDIFVPVLSQRAALALRDLLTGVELLPVVAGERQWLACNTPVVEGALDHARSDIKFFKSGKVMRILRAEFHTAAIQSHPIFRIAEVPFGRVFVNEAFVQAVALEPELKGLALDPP